MPQKDSPNRRRSIAAAGHSKPSAQKSRRRAYSIVGGDRLSPLAKARRSLVPRKSILKVPISAQNPEQSSQSSNVSGEDGTTMDFTQVVRDVAPRKSLSRRVSFAESTYVRYSIPSSRVQFSEDPESPTQADGEETDENAYPGSSRRRRNSMRYSMAGSEDMDLTTIIPNSLAAGVAVREEESYDGDDMEMTQVVPSGRRSSGGGRQPLSQLQSANSEDPNESHSYSEEDSQAQSEDMSLDLSEHIDFVIPLNQPLRPAQQDEVWLALRRMTETDDTSGDVEEQEEDDFDDGAGIDLEDARQRLLRARESLPQSAQSQDTTLEESVYPVEGSYPDASFTSTDDSLLADDGEIDGNKTLNMSKVLQRESLGGLANGRLSMGYQEVSMEESEIYGSALPVQPQPEANREVQAAPQPPAAHAQPGVEESRAVLSKSTVFHPPIRETSTASLSTSVPPGGKPPTSMEPPSIFPTSVPFTFTAPTMSSQAKSQPKSPQKSPVKPTFTAAFAPPVARSASRASIGSNPPSSPSKRPRSNVEDDAERPSPAKRLAIASKWSATVSPAGPSMQSPKPRPLSPSKRAPFQAGTQTGAGGRRPSGYFARRKSLGVGLGAKIVDEAAEDVAPLKTLPKKNAVGRASLGAASSTPWTKPESHSQLGPTPEESHTEVDKDTRGQKHSPRDLHEEARDPVPAVLDMSAQFQQMSDPMEPEQGPAAPMTVNDRAGPLYSSTRQWREQVEPTAMEEEEEIPPISIEQFFEFTGISFMDQLTAPRRSLHPSQQLRSQPRKQEEIPLAEYAVAVGIDVPQLALFTNVSRELQNWMEKSKAEYIQAEDEAAKLTPELFAEYARADDEGKAELRHQLLLIRTHSRESAKSDWYKWKHEWVNGLRVTAQQAFEALESDARVLQGLQIKVDELIPSLEQEYESIMRELEQEEAEIKEVEQCDQGYLNELKVSLADQGAEVEMLQNDLSERKSTLQFSQDKLQELETQKAEAMAAIANAQRTLNMQQNGTRSEVFRLKEELEALEELHRFRLTKASPELVEFVYGSHFFVSIPCQKFIPVIKKVSITRYEKTRHLQKDDFPELSNFFLRTAPKLLADPQIQNLRQVVRRLSDYWTSCAQLRSQLTLLNIRYPISFLFTQPGDPAGFKVTVKVLFPRVHAKAMISFLFPLDLFSKWPESLDGLDCEVTVGYGPIERSTIIKAVIDHLATRNPSENYACLLDACIDAQALYA